MRAIRETQTPSVANGNIVTVSVIRCGLKELANIHYVS